MAILTQKQIIDQLDQGKLIKNARKKDNGVFDVEAASYDLSVGTAVCKKHNRKPFQKKHQTLSIDQEKLKQKTVTLSPGQMVFVITHEELMLPNNIYGTVYSRNSLSQNGILALNAGHIDPGFNGPITIKLINLRSIDYTFSLGEPIFTIIFNTIDSPEYINDPYRLMTKEDTLKRVNDTTDMSLDNALYDLALLRDYVRVEEFGKAYWKWLYKSLLGIITIIFSLVGVIYTILKVYELLIKLKGGK